MPDQAPSENPAPSFLERRLAGVESRLSSAEKAIVSNAVSWTDNFIKRHAEVFVLGAFIAGYMLRLLMKG